MSEIAERLRPEIESKVASYLRSIKPIDALYSAGQIKLAVEGNPSDEGYHLDYASLSVGRYGHTAKGGLHRVTTVMWEMPFRIMKNNFKGTHSPDKK
ncbi:MAG: hypothetical protein IPL49_05910 [Saprospirales bacterium]|nr:hypothetical protein [Saprospirales bacterium]